MQVCSLKIGASFANPRPAQHFPASLPLRLLLPVNVSRLESGDWQE